MHQDMVNQSGYLPQQVVIGSSQMEVLNRPHHVVSVSGPQIGFSNGPIAQQPMREFVTVGQVGQQTQRLQSFVPVSQPPTYVVNQAPNPVQLTNHSSHQQQQVQQPPHGSFQQLNLPVSPVQSQSNVISNQSKFESGARFEPEIVGQRIETVVHMRQDPHRNVAAQKSQLVPHRKNTPLRSVFILMF